MHRKLLSFKKKKSKFYFAYWSCTFVFQLTAPSWHQLNQWTGGWEASWNFSIFSSLQMRKLVQSLANNNLLMVPEGTPHPPSRHQPSLLVRELSAQGSLAHKDYPHFEITRLFFNTSRNWEFWGSSLFKFFFFSPTWDSEADTLLSSREHS